MLILKIGPNSIMGIETARSKFLRVFNEAIDITVSTIRKKLQDHKQNSCLEDKIKLKLVLTCIAWHILSQSEQNSDSGNKYTKNDVINLALTRGYEVPTWTDSRLFLQTLYPIIHETYRFVLFV